MVEQDAVVAALCSVFSNARVVDRRQQPSHDYRAVHVIVGAVSGLVEVQVRTALQHQWAEVSEKFSDVLDPTIKYGGGAGIKYAGGDETVRGLLAETSELALSIDTAEATVARLDLEGSRVDERAAVLAELSKLRASVSTLFSTMVDEMASK